MLEEEYYYGGFARDLQFGMSRQLFGKMARETKAITINPDHKYMMDGVSIIIIDCFDRDYAYCIINGVYSPVEKKKVWEMREHQDNQTAICL